MCPADAVFSVAWSPAHTDLVCTGSGDDSAYLWRVGLDCHRSTHQLQGHTDTVASVSFNASGTLVATGGLDGLVKIWESSTGSLTGTLEGPGDAIDWLQWHPKGNVLLAGSEDFSAWMWSAETGIMMQCFVGHTGAVRCGAFTPDGKAVVTGGGAGDASLKVWDPKTGACGTTLQGHGFHEAGLTCLAISADSSIAITGSEDHTARISNIQSGRILGTLTGHQDSVEAVALSSVLPLSATGSIDGKLMIWDNASLSVRGTCPHPEAVVDVRCHPTKALVFTACLDGAVRCWDLRTGVCLATRTGHTQGVQSIALSPDGHMVISGSDDRSVRIFNF
eukprot:jgi/Astpho2/841/e_gw1.00016.344.1_t